MTVNPSRPEPRYESRRGRILPPDLDDRTWQDLVGELRALVPQYAPQWTDQNPSDLGTTLLELFAWLAEGMIYRINRTPEKNYVHFLNLLGITRDPGAPARTHLTFQAGAAPVTVAAGAQAQTASRDGRPVVFETDEDVTVLPTTLTAALLVGPTAGATPSGTYRDVAPALIGPSATKLQLDLPADRAVHLLLGFDRAVAGELALGWRLFRALAAPTPTLADGADPIGVTWTHSPAPGAGGATVEPSSWPVLGTVADGTDRLSRDGRISLTLPAAWTAQRAAGEPATKPWSSVTPATPADAVTTPLFWVGLRIVNGSGAATTLGLDRLLFNAASARTALTPRAPEELGVSDGRAFQVFELAHRPLFRAPGPASPYAHLAVQVGTGTPTVWEDWAVVEDIPAGAGPVCRLDPVTGEILFGNHDPSSGSGNGSVPPAGARVRALRYRYVAAGAAGNVDAGQVTVLGTNAAGGQVTGVAGVTNQAPARDGVDEEPIEDTLRRAPEELKIRDRAVTADDYEFLAREAGQELAVVRCLTPRLQTADAPGAAPPPWLKGDPWGFAGITRAPGNVTVVVVPDQGEAVARPEPTPDQLRAVRAHLEPRRDLTTHLDVVGPRYLPVVVTVEIVVWQQAVDAGLDLKDVSADTLRRIRSFLHPTAGGPAGGGWQVGQPVFSSDLFRAIMPAEDVGYISSIALRPDVPLYHFPPINPAGTAANYDAGRERPIPLSGNGASVRVADYELVCAGADDAHRITTTKAPL